MGVHDQDTTDTSRYSLEQSSVVKFGLDSFVWSHLGGLSVGSVREKKENIKKSF